MAKRIVSKLKSSKSVKDSLGFLSASLTSQVVVFLSGIFVIRSLGPELRGYYSFLAIIGFFLVPIFSFGFIAGLGYYISSKKYKAVDVSRSVVWIAIARGGIIVLTVLILHHFKLLGQTGNKLNVFQLAPVLLTFPFNLIKESFHRMLLSDSKYAQANKLTVIYSLSSPVIIFILVVILKLEFTGVLIGIVLANLTNFGLTMYFFHRAYGEISSVKEYNKPFVKQVFQYGVKGWIGDIAVTTNNRADQLILSYFLQPASLGLYSICGNIGQMLWLLPGSIRQILYNKNAALKDDQDRKILTAKYHAFFMITGAVLTILAIIFAPLIVRILFGKDFLNAIVPLQIYLIGTGTYIGTMVITKYFVGTRKIIYTSYIQLFSAIVGVITAFIFISKYGLIGAAISSSISYFASYLLSIYYFKDIKILIKGFTSFISIFKPQVPVPVKAVAATAETEGGTK